MNEKIKQKIEKLLSVAVEKNASDLHISAKNPPVLRIMGELSFFSEFNEITPEESKEMAFSLMSDEQKTRFLNDKEIDFSYELNKRNRFRVNIFSQRESISSSFRFVPTKIKTIEDLNLPHFLNSFCKERQGFILITGPSSHGKSTTLAALIEEINQNFFRRIITIEDPIEYVFSNKKSVIEQREVYSDTKSFSRGLKSVFRQDPDVIMVGEMRDPETISAAITAAETGHLVFSTLHTNSASESIHRIIDSFPSEQQNQIRVQLASSLLGIVSQRLISRKKGGLIPACEILLSNSASANIIRENRIHELNLVIETSSNHGMISLDKSLNSLVDRDEISKKDALTYSRDPNKFKETI